MSVSFVLLSFKEHPISRMMLAQLLEQGFKPQCVIEEVSDFGAKKTAIYDPLVRHMALPTISAQCKAHEINRLEVANINDDTAIEELARLAVDLILLGNTRIIKPEVFSCARAGCINIHPGLLPEVKGAFPQVWSILNDKPIGCTSHLIDEDIDTGPIIQRQEIDVSREDTLDAIMLKTMRLSAQLMVGAVSQYANKGQFNLITPDRHGEYYGLPEPALIEKARERLKDQAYGHYCDVVS